MALRHLIIAATLVSFVPAVMPVITTDKAKAVETVKKKRKKTVQKKRASGAGEPNASWSEDCIHHYNINGKLPFWCDKYGRGRGRP